MRSYLHAKILIEINAELKREIAQEGYFTSAFCIMPAFLYFKACETSLRSLSGGCPVHNNVNQAKSQLKNVV